MIVDAHFHLWDPARRDHGWLAEEPAVLRRRFALDELEAVAAATGVEAGVLVQVLNDADESAEFLALAAASPFAAGVVGWVDLLAADVAGELAALRGAPGGGLLVGIRHLVQDEPDPGFVARPEVVRGLEAVAAAGLAFDLLVRPAHLPAALAAARRLEGLRIVLDHGGKPPIATGRESDAWWSAVAELAACENVTCKLSGLVTEAGEGWTIGEILPYADHLLDLFGPRRLLFGSDWPVCTAVATYGDVLEAARTLLGGLERAELDAVLGGNCARVYRLPAAGVPPGAPQEDAADGGTRPCGGEQTGGGH